MISIYGINLTKEEIAERSKWHSETWIEAEIPKKIYKKVSKYIDKEVEKFEKKCGCPLCKRHKRKPV